MKNIILFMTLTLASALAFGLTPPPTPFPVFLKEGFSAVLEFTEAPTNVVLGDSRHFMVQKLGNALVVKPLMPSASSDMFVYFRSAPPRLFVLTASNDDQPTFFKRFSSEISLHVPELALRPMKIEYRGSEYREGLRVLSARLSSKKDYLTVEAIVSTGSRQKLTPNWPHVHLLFQGKSISPLKLWSERREIQKDSSAKCRFIFLKPNLSRQLWPVKLVIPLSGKQALTAHL